jgi:hypothetical protein
MLRLAELARQVTLPRRGHPWPAAGQGKFFAFFGDTRRLRRNSVEKIFPPIYAEKHRVSPKVSSCFEEALICSLTANQCSFFKVDSLPKNKDF